MSRRRRSPSGRYYRWDEVVAELRSKPGRWVLAFPHHPASLAKHIRRRRAPELIIEDGRVEVDLQHSHRDAEGNRVADVWVRFVPHTVDSGASSTTPTTH